MAAPSGGDAATADARTGDGALRRRRADSADDAQRTPHGVGGEPEPKRLRRDGEDVEMAASTPESRSVDDEDDDMELTTQRTDEDEDDAVEVPQTPPPVQVSAAALARQAGRSPELRIDPTAKAHQPPARVAPPHISYTLVLRHKFPLLTDKSRMYSPTERDVDGQPWRVVWFPHGQFLDDQYVSVQVEMMTDEGDAAAVPERQAIVEFSLVSPRDSDSLKHTERSEVVTFDKEMLDFGIERFVRRARIISPSEALLNAEGDVEVDVRVHFVENEASDTVDLDVDVEAEDDLLGIPGDTTPVVTPTASTGPPTVGTPAHFDLTTYDSKAETGMVGLKNQGATCYLNSLLQTLFHLLAFRHAVYQTPTEQEDTNDSVSLALQRVFYRLQTQRKAVSTKELTRSFGWSQMDAFMQHDVQELYRILCDRLEEKMKNTKVDNAIKKLFEGKVRSFVQCVNVDFQSFRDESFYDLQLDVKGCKDIYASFRKYIEIEMLNGDNQYEAEGHGKQDAKKGVKFLQFPPVLNIQLKRFEYDPMRDGMVKIHDRFEFPKTLVLNEFAPKQAEEHGESGLVYHLHSVLVHSGDVHGGHYYVFIRPGKNIAGSTDWFRFDDDQITRVDEQIAIEGNYGSGSPNLSSSGPSTPNYSSILSPDMTPRESNGQDGSMDFRPLSDDATDTDDALYQGPASGPEASSSGNSLMLPLGRSFSSAYMLVYVRANDKDLNVFDEETSETSATSPQDAEDPTKSYEHVDNIPIPGSLLERFHEEEKATARRKKLQQTEHLYMTFRIASDTSVSKLKKITKNIDFSSFGNNAGLRIRIKRDSTIRQLYARIHKRTGVPVAQQRLWKVITRENRTHRPDSPITSEMLDSRVDQLIDEDASAKAPVRLYLQVVDPCDASGKEKAIYRHFLAQFTAPVADSVADAESVQAEGGAEEEHEEVVDDAHDADKETSVTPAPNIGPSEILLFIKFYDVKKKLNDRLEYMGNILFDSRKSGAELVKHLHEALKIPSTTELILYEEIQPMSVAEIDMDNSLEASEIQHGDIICYQYAEDEEAVRQERHDSTQIERYPDVPTYFQYLLDRIDVLFYAYGHAEEEPTVIPLLYSNTYDDIIDALVKQLGLPEEKRLYIRLYQHSPLNQMPKNSPLRHSKYSGDRQTTLGDFLTEYSERTNAMHYEILSNPITEIESKKQIAVYFSIYDDCFVDPSSPTTPRRFEFLMVPSSTLIDLFAQITQAFELDPTTKLRACEVSHNGSLVVSIIKEADVSLEKYWMSSTGYMTVNDITLFVERVPDEEIDAMQEHADGSNPTEAEEAESENRLFHMGVVHFNFQLNGQHWIHPHGVPCVTYFREQETVSQVKARIRRRIGVSEEVFAKWELSVVKDIKASTLIDLYEDMDAEAIENFAMAKLEDVCGLQFENITSLGVEHADPKPASSNHMRRQEQGIKIRQG